MTMTMYKVKYYVLRSVNTLILFGIRKKPFSSGRNILLCQFTRMAIKLTVVIIKAVINIAQNVIWHSFSRLSLYADKTMSSSMYVLT
jgi:hypothetical protein